MRFDSEFWQGRHVLITGHTGFKGSWLALWLQKLGAEVTGVALPPQTDPNLFELANVDQGIESHFCDINQATKLETIVRRSEPEIVFHLAAQPLVRASYHDPLLTFSTNIMGTAHLLESLRWIESVRVAVMVTTDKVYKNMEHIYPYREEDALGGHDPYSASKAAVEIVIASYRDSFLADQGIAVATTRAGNVIGGGDWSEERLIPDAVRAWQKGETLNIRRPDAVRPWQHVLEPLAGYLMLAEQLWHKPALAGAYNFGPLTHETVTVKELVELARRAHSNSAVCYGDSTDGPHEAHLLALEIAKARVMLGFSPRWNLDQTVKRTMNWYLDQQTGADTRALCERDIADYMLDAC